MKRLCAVVVLLGVLEMRSGGATRGRGEEGSRVQKPRISGLSQTTCTVLDDGSVRCWGAGGSGQLGNATFTATQPLPVQADVKGVVAIASGVNHACALEVGGTVRCWGNNAHGQLGNGTTGGNSSFSVPVVSLDQVVAIAAGADFTCAVRSDGTARCWGRNQAGMLGNGTLVNSPSPVTVSGLNNAVAITAGQSYACALISNGTVQCWGDDSTGQLGDGLNATRAVPAPVSGLTGAVELASGWAHTCALVANGGARCWGLNSAGQLGDGTTTTRNVPAPVSQLSQAISIAAGLQHTCAVRSDGGMRCWGLNSSGQLGDGTAIQRLDAATAVVGLSNAVAVSAGNTHTCALDATGSARCWGANNVGQLGNGTTSPSSTPLTVTGIAGTTAARGVVTGASFTCARRGAGGAVCWGDDSFDELGNGPGGINSPNPVNVSGLTDAVALAAGVSHACVIRAGGTVACWGKNLNGQLGNGNTAIQATPVAVAGLSGVVSISAGQSHTCALLHDGAARCWGDNSDGQLGNGSNTGSLLPVTVTGLNDAVAIAAGDLHTCALVADGSMRCWGNNILGQLGDGTNIKSNIPVAVVGITNAVALAATDHTCALLANGSSRCWGNNSKGQLGNSTSQNRNSPDIVSGLSDALSVTNGLDHTCAVRGAGIADCWGSNFSSQLSAADIADHNTPTGVFFQSPRGLTRLTGIVAMAAGADSISRAHTCALQANGLPQCWGDNSHGQIGDGSTTDRPRPTPVPSFTANVAVQVTLSSNGRVAKVTGLINCEEGSHAQIFITLHQDDVEGSGVATTSCTDRLLEVPLNVAAHGRDGFVSGPATATLEAIVRDQGVITQHLFWTRAVTVAE